MFGNEWEWIGSWDIWSQHSADFSGFGRNVTVPLTSLWRPRGFYIQYFFVFLFLTAISLLVSRVPSCIWANAGYSPEWIARLSILWLRCSLWPVNNRYKWRFIIIYLQEYSEKYKCSFWNLKWFNINRTIIYCTIYDYKYDLTVECYSYVSSGQVQVLHVYEYSRVISLVSKMYRLELSWLLIVV